VASYLKLAEEYAGYYPKFTEEQASEYFGADDYGLTTAAWITNQTKIVGIGTDCFTEAVSVPNYFTIEVLVCVSQGAQPSYFDFGDNKIKPMFYASKFSHHCPNIKFAYSHIWRTWVSTSVFDVYMTPSMAEQLQSTF